MSLQNPLDRLIAVKIRALLHDPPHKSWCLLEQARGRRCSHEEEARNFRSMLVAGTLIDGLGIEQYEEPARRADGLAAGLDRWVLGLHFQKAGYIVGTTKYANIFNPKYKTDLGEIKYEEIQDKVLKLAADVNKLLRKLKECREVIDEADGSSSLLLSYLLLYSVLEPLHYKEGLPPALADTRVPTHTVYDHLYATASMANLTALAGEEPVKGFYVIVDVPGIQEFVSSARRASDFWAASWLLSQVVWRLVSKLMSYLGPDILISPSPRFNPFLYSFILDKLKEVRELAKEKGATTCSTKIDELIRDLKELFNWILIQVSGLRTSDKGLDVESIKHYALIPATIFFVLPKLSRLEIKLSNGEKLALELDSVEKVAKSILRLFEASWSEVVEEVIRELKELCRGGTKDNISFCVAYALLDHVREVASKPPIGPRVIVVDVEEVYASLVNCLEGVEESCKVINVGVSMKELMKLLDKLSTELDTSREEVVRKLAVSLLFHVVTKVARRKKPETIPIPLTYWLVKDGEFKLAFPALEKLLEKIAKNPLNWIPCSLCGLEPAVIRLRKDVKRSEAGTYIETFNDDDVKRVKELVEARLVELGIEITLDPYRLGDGIRKAGFRPGESLGPHCILKRAVYLALRERERIKSTDDVALAYYTHVLERLFEGMPLVSREEEEIEKSVETLIAEEICKRLEGRERSECILAVRYILDSDRKEIEEAAKTLKITLDHFRKLWTEAVVKAVRKRYRGRKQELATKLVKLVEEVYGLKDDSIMQAIGITEQVIKSRLERILEHLVGLRTSYLIVRADADNISLLHDGVITSLTCSEYVDALLQLLQEAEVRGEREKVIELLRKSFGNMCQLLIAIHSGEERKPTVPVSPSYISALSTALTITALKDYAAVKEMEGVLVFSGGDDLVAFLPPEMLARALTLRINYAGGSYQKNVADYFHKIKIAEGREIVIAPAIPLGKSMSIRVAELMDVMSSEVAAATDLLEDVAKETTWIFDSQEWEKDSVVFSYSRRPIKAILPLSVRVSEQEVIVPALAKLISRLQAMLLLGLLSPSLPEDFENRYGEAEALEVLSKRADELKKLVEYVIQRNVPEKIVGKLKPSLLLGHDIRVKGQEFDSILMKTRVEIRGSLYPLLLSLIDIVKLLRVLPCKS